MDKGQSLVEFGVSLVVLMFLLSGLVEFGIIFFQYVQLRDAAQEGALFGASCANCTIAEIEERTRYASDTPINLKENTSVSVLVTAADKSGNLKHPELACEGEALTVQVSYAHRIFMPFLPKLLGVSHINLNASVVDTVLVPIC
jgi:Flp pilus assembly protein TadG